MHASAVLSSPWHHVDQRVAASGRPRPGTLGHQVHRDGRCGRAQEGELSDPEAAAAHAEALCIPEAHPLASPPGLDWPQ